jgi:hypothetical protein
MAAALTVGSVATLLLQPLVPNLRPILGSSRPERLASDCRKPTIGVGTAGLAEIMEAVLEFPLARRRRSVG